MFQASADHLGKWKSRCYGKTESVICWLKPVLLIEKIKALSVVAEGFLIIWQTVVDKCGRRGSLHLGECVFELCLN